MPGQAGKVAFGDGKESGTGLPPGQSEEGERQACALSSVTLCCSA